MKNLWVNYLECMTLSKQKQNKKSYRPGKKTQIELKRPDLAGEKKESALTVGIVDEGVFALEEMEPLDRLSFFLDRKLQKSIGKIRNFTSENKKKKADNLAARVLFALHKVSTLAPTMEDLRGNKIRDFYRWKRESLKNDYIVIFIFVTVILILSSLLGFFLFL